MDSLYAVAYSSPVKRKILGDINNTADSPISPTANLKLLTKVASQCDSIENVYCVETPPNSRLSEGQSVNLNANLLGKESYRRKFKSLGYLCDNFLKLFPLDVPDDRNYQILLSDLANQLGVEKRRIYDIINVVESLQMATKVGKNSYSWAGQKNLPNILSQLKAWAEQVGLMQYVQAEQIKRKLYLKLHDDEIGTSDQFTFAENSNITSFFRNERRIGILCQKFVMLFLVSLKDGLINLELAAKVLVGNDCQQNKTRLRRLYDIANILVSLGIISKHETSGLCKKPVFQYVGPRLHKFDGPSNQSFFTNLVKTEPSEGSFSDASEDSSSRDSLLKPAESCLSQMFISQSDHSYSLNSMSVVKSVETPVEPAAKKRLVFVTENTNRLVVAGNVTNTNTIEPTRLRVLQPQPITNGGLYKAVRVGNNFQLIRIRDS